MEIEMEVTFPLQGSNVYLSSPVENILFRVVVQDGEILETEVFDVHTTEKGVTYDFGDYMVLEGCESTTINGRITKKIIIIDHSQVDKLKLIKRAE